MPMGAKFLADAIMADVIDYDEFLTVSIVHLLFYCYVVSCLITITMYTFTMKNTNTTIITNTAGQP
jgi:hypothetical protein